MFNDFITADSIAAEFEAGKKTTADKCSGILWLKL